MPRLILSCFGAGFVPWAPGTVGSGVAVAVYLSLRAVVGGWNAAIACGALSVLCGALTVGLVPLVVRDEAAKGEGAGSTDPQFVVTDEMSGMFLALALAPGAPAWLAGGAGFCLFRLLDITKPLGIRRLEKLKCGWGVLADDVAAGALTGAGLNLASALWSAIGA
jgi:phosphatidylglycerophosphatase A